MSRLYIGGLNYRTENDGLRQGFSRFGNVVDAIVVRDRESGRSRGFGFVTFEKDEEAQAAIEQMNNTEFEGRRISVARASERTGGSGSPREGGFRGGNSGGFRGGEGGYRNAGGEGGYRGGNDGGYRGDGGYRQSGGY